LMGGWVGRLLGWAGGWICKLMAGSRLQGGWMGV
jgi:hypothetical protein